MKVEMIDRFGPMPQYTQSLFRSAQIKLRAGELGIRKIDAGATSGYFIFEEQNKIDSKRVLKLVQGKPKDYRLDGPLKLRFTHDARSEENLFTRIEMLVELLA
jgi:transcription-repair coupling factor (superfamily II helicase)